MITVADVRHLLAAADHVVHPFVRPDDDRGLGVPVPDLPGLGKVEPARTREQARLRKLGVALGEALVLLVCQAPRAGLRRASVPGLPDSSSSPPSRR